MRILVVEDDRNAAETLRRTLVAQGWAVDVVHDGDSGLARATHGDYHAVVLDIMLPGRSGYEVLRGFRAREVWTPVMMLTAKDGEYDQIDASAPTTTW